MTVEEREDRETVLRRVDLRELLDSIGRDRGLASRHKQYPCPSDMHGGQTGDTPPVSVTDGPEGYAIWNCHSCDTGGTAIDALLVSGRARDNADAFEQLGSRTLPPRPEPPARAMPEPEPDVDPIPDGVLARIDEVKAWRAETLGRLGVTWDAGDKRFAFPVRDAEGQLVGMVRYVPGGKPKSKADSGTTRLPFPAPESIDGDEVWIVEGEGDAISGHEIGLPAVGIPGVSSWKPAWAERFKRFKRAIVCGDCDQPGRDMARRIAADLAVAGVEACVLDLAPERDDHYDLGDLVAKDVPRAGRDGVASLVRAAAALVKPLPVADVLLEQEIARISTTGLPITLNDAASLIGGVDTKVPAVWGEHPFVLWARGEPFMIAGATGTGKTTIAQQVILRMVGVLDGPFLGQPVVDDGRAVMYLALDRDQQAQRSLRRMTAELPPGRLMWQSDLGDYRPTRHDPTLFVDWLALHGIGAVVLDSLYGMLATGKDEDKLEWYAKMLRALAAKHVEIIVLHHFRKRGDDGEGGALIDRVYGGQQVTAAQGSILALSGEPGDEEVDAFHIKQPAKVCGPWTLTHNQETGVTASLRHPTALEHLQTVGQASTDEVMEVCKLASRKRSRRALDHLVATGVALKAGDVYQLADPRAVAMAGRLIEPDAITLEAGF